MPNCPFATARHRAKNPKQAQSHRKTAVCISTPAQFTDQKQTGTGMEARAIFQMEEKGKLLSRREPPAWPRGQELR